MHVKAVFQIPGPKFITIGLDINTVTAVTTQKLTDAAAAAYSGWSGSPNLRARYSANTNMHHCEAYAYDIVASGLPAPKPPFKRNPTLGPVSSTVALVSGTAGTVALSPNVAQVITFRTDLSSRRTRGRVYMPPPPTGFTNEQGVMDATNVTALSTAFNSWVTGILNAAPLGDNWQHQVLSLQAGSARQVLQRQVKARVDTQRRRLVRTLDI
jgi:hypothetical protein